MPVAAELVRVPRPNVGRSSTRGLSDVSRRSSYLTYYRLVYQAVLNGKVREGSTLAIFGAGPVGLMAAASARMLGAEKIYMVDHNPYRLQFAKDRYGVIPINFDEVDDPAQFIIEHENFRGVDCSVDAVGFENKGSILETALATVKVEGGSGFVLRQMIAATRRGGYLSVPGVYAGWLHGFLFGDSFDKGLNWCMGQTHVQKLMPELLNFINSGALLPDEIITHTLSLADAAGLSDIDKKESMS